MAQQAGPASQMAMCTAFVRRRCRREIVLIGSDQKAHVGVLLRYGRRMLQGVTLAKARHFHQPGSVPVTSHVQLPEWGLRDVQCNDKCLLHPDRLAKYAAAYLRCRAPLVRHYGRAGCIADADHLTARVAVVVLLDRFGKRDAHQETALQFGGARELPDVAPLAVQMNGLGSMS